MKVFKSSFKVTKDDKNQYGQTDQRIQKDRFVQFQSDCMQREEIDIEGLKKMYEFTFDYYRMKEFCAKFPDLNESVTMELRMWCTVRNLHVECIFVHNNKIISSFLNKLTLTEYHTGQKVILPLAILDKIGPKE